MSNVIIKPQDQSAPKEHWAEGEIRKAEEEIRSGNYIPDPDPQAREEQETMNALGLALSAGTEDGVAFGKRATLQEMQFTQKMAFLGRHPRVAEAMDRMSKEIEEAKGSEAIEKTCMMREMALEDSKRQRWAEQGKLAGEENEESRYGLILTPVQFYDKLGKVIGKGRIKLSPHVVKSSPEARSGRVGLYVKNPAYVGGSQIFDNVKQDRAKELRENGEKELMKAKRTRKLGMNSEADKRFELAGDMAQAATEILMEITAEQQLRPPELLRVATLQWPCGTEWMVCNFNEYGVVTSAKYIGWRTALLQMIRCGAISEKEAHKAFPVGSGPAGDWYLEQLTSFRNTTGMVQ